MSKDERVNRMLQLLDEGKTRVQIAAITNTPASTVAQWIRTARPKDIFATPRKTLVHNEFARGERDIPKLAKKYGCCNETIYDYRRQYLEDRDLEDTYCMSRLKVSQELGIAPKTVKSLEESAMEKMKVYIDANPGLEDALKEIFTLSGMKEDGGSNWNA